jgi:hypothetical protein
MFKSMNESLYVPLHVNVATFERVLRVLVGVLFLALAVAGPRNIWGLLGLVPLVTGAMGYCPLYAMLSRLSQLSRHGHSH